MHSTRLGLCDCWNTNGPKERCSDDDDDDDDDIVVALLGATYRASFSPSLFPFFP